MGFNNFWNDRADAANEFLRTGQARDKSILARDNTAAARYNTAAARDNALNTGASCVSTSQCPSGWGCVDGVCRQLNNSGTGSGGPSQNNSPSGGGPCNEQDPESPCNSGGPNSCQQTPQCGDTDDEARDCCGTRCCSFGSASSSRPGVHCFCGECPPWPGCTSFCDSYLKSNGEVGPGCQEGTDGNSCDGCTECDGDVGGECQPISTGASCWCGGGECNTGNCEKCVTDENSPDFGDCALDAGNCQQCATITNHVCPCGFAFSGQPVLPPITVCKSYGEGGILPINLAQQEAAKQCDEICNGDGKEDPCKPKTSSATYCTDTGTGAASCPEGTTQTGTLEAGGESCAFCETADYSDLPDSCEACDCNCHNDCPECQLCGADGTCYPDPVCEADEYFVSLVLTQAGHYFGYSGPPTIINCGPLSGDEQTVSSSYRVSKEDLGRYTVEYVTTPYTERFETVCTSCIENEGANDECTGSSACPSTVITARALVNGALFQNQSYQVSGCRIFEPQGGFTSWFYTGGTLEWRATPIFD